jgi:hypothetical protein
MSDSGSRRTDHEARIKALEWHLWRGNGDSLTTKVSKLEENDRGRKELVEDLNRKIDRLSWLVGIGLGVLLAAEFFLKR